MNYDILPTKLGDVTMSANKDGLTSLHIAGDRYFSGPPLGWQQDGTDPHLVQAKRELTEYLDGQRKAFDIPVYVEGTPFQRDVWEAVRKIPYGQSATYFEIATIIGKPTATRAVGSAIGRNPICIVIPCHRVLVSDGSLGGYVAGLVRKEELLELEGTRIRMAKLFSNTVSK